MPLHSNFLEDYRIYLNQNNSEELQTLNQLIMLLAGDLFSLPQFENFSIAMVLPYLLLNAYLREYNYLGDVNDDWLLEIKPWLDRLFSDEVLELSEEVSTQHSFYLFITQANSRCRVASESVPREEAPHKPS